MAMVVSLVACKKSDDTSLWNELWKETTQTKASLQALKSENKDLTDDIAALQAVISSYENNYNISSLNPIVQDGDTIGWKFGFDVQAADDVTIYTKPSGNGSSENDGNLFKSVTQDAHNVYFTLADNTVITIAKAGSGSESASVVIDNGKLPGKFSVSADKQVQFSQGNLQYNAGTDVWRFATNQYDYVGDRNENISSTYGGWIDLFGWGTSGWNSGAKAYQPYSTSTTNADYYPGNSATTNLTGTYANADWGVYNAISNGGNAKGLWRVLTNAEWAYLFNSRNNAANLYGHAVIGNINGMIILPDDFERPYGLSFTPGKNSYITNMYTLVEWKAMEAAGAVFLPAAGVRNGTSMHYVGTYGLYWSSTYLSSNDAYRVYFYSGGLDPSYSSGRHTGRSVRLIKDLN